MLKFLGETLFPNKVVIQNGNGPWTEFMLEKNPILKGTIPPSCVDMDGMEVTKIYLASFQIFRRT